MIVGIGNDIIEIERFEKINIDKFIERYFTEKEISLFDRRKNKLAVIAGNFAVKEAVSKCFGTGVRGFSLRDIEVLRDELGAPYVSLYGACLDLANERNIDTWHISMSNSDSYVSVVAIAEKRINDGKQK